MLGPEIEGEVAQGGFGHNGLASAAGSTLAADAGSRSIDFQFHRADVIDAARTGRASGTSMLLSLLEMAWLRWGQAMTDRTNGESAFHVAGIASIDMISTAPNAEVVPLKINAPR